MDRIRVLIVARTLLFRGGLSALIGSELDMEKVGEAATPDCAVQLFAALHPDVTVIDMDLPGCGGLAVIRHILAVDPKTCVIGLLTDEWDEQGREAVAAGAWSCLGKDRVLTELPAAIRRQCGRSQPPKHNL
jgi:two-component system, NarL family, response regulator